MSRRKYIPFSVLIFIFCIAQLCNGQNASITGRLLVPEKKTAKKTIADTMVDIKIGEYQSSTYLSKKLSFKFDSLVAGEGFIHISNYYNFRDTFIFLTLHENECVHLKIPYPPFCKYEKSKNNKKCPVCGKRDKVLPIQYGLLIFDPEAKPNKKRFWPGGCEVTCCDPNWHCERDDFDF